jgi:hypothetical protein
LPQRKANSPWGSSYKEGLPTTSVNDSIDVDQMIRPMVDCGVISRESGQWEGVTTSDEQFIGITISLGVANSGEILVPDTNAYPSIDMTGFCNLALALKPTNGGTYGIKAVMGPDTLPFGGLSPVNAAASLRYARNALSTFEPLFDDSNETLTADVWNIFIIQCRTEGQKNLQFKITNSSGGTSDIEFAFLRMVK